MCQTPVICEYLGQQFDLYPDTDVNVWKARQINQTIYDFQDEGNEIVCYLKGHAKVWNHQKIGWFYFSLIIWPYDVNID